VLRMLAVNGGVLGEPVTVVSFLGIFASYLLVLRRENRRFPWKPFLTWAAVGVGILAFSVLMLIFEFHYHLTWHLPFLVK
jgi:sec-independent protein translocase protein TatC